MKSFEWRKTEDGSLAFYSYEFEELSHSPTSSKIETYQYFIHGTHFLERIQEKKVSILEIGFGAGINYSYFKESTNVEFSYIGLEKNEEFKDYVFQNKNLKVLWGDATQTIQKLQGQVFDIIIHDGFSSKKDNSLWTVSFVKQLLRLTHSKSILSTYSTLPRAMKSFFEAGWYLERVVGLYPKKYSLRAYPYFKEDTLLRKELVKIEAF